MPVAAALPMIMSMMGSQGGSGGGAAGGGWGGLASGLIGGVTGYFQKRKAKGLLKAAGEQPIYNIPQEILRNQKQAELNAQEGMPSQQYNNAMKNIQRSQTNVLSSSLDRRSALMALPRLQQQANDAYGNLDSQDAQMRRQNQNTLYGIGNTTAQYRDKAWNTNELQPWQRKYSYAMQLLGTGNQNLVGGLDKIAGSLLGGGIGGGGGGLLTGGGKSTQTPERDTFGAFQ